MVAQRAGILRFQFLLRILQVIDEDVVNRDRHRSQTLQTAGVRIVGILPVKMRS